MKQQQKNLEVNAILVPSRGWSRKEEEERIRNCRDRAITGTGTDTEVKVGTSAG